VDSNSMPSEPNRSPLPPLPPQPPPLSPQPPPSQPPPPSPSPSVFKRDREDNQEATNAKRGKRSLDDTKGNTQPDEFDWQRDDADERSDTRGRERRRDNQWETKEESGWDKKEKDYSLWDQRPKETSLWDKKEKDNNTQWERREREEKVRDRDSDRKPRESFWDRRDRPEQDRERDRDRDHIYRSRDYDERR